MVLLKELIMNLKTILALCSLVFLSYAMYLAVSEEYAWLAVWLICSKILSLTLKEDILHAMTRKRGE